MSNEAAKPLGLGMQEGLPATAEELIAKALDLGVKLGKPSKFGFRSVDRSSPVPVVTEGESIVDAAAGLRARRRGEIAIGGHGIVTEDGKRFLARVEASRLSESSDA